MSTNAYYEGKYFNFEDMAGRMNANATFEDCNFSHCQFQEADISKSRFVNCTFIECDLSNVHISETVFQEVRFDGCKMIGIQFESANQYLFTPEFNVCKLDYASFHGRKMNGWHFKGCSMQQVDFSEADLRDAHFEECDLRDALFEQTNLQGCDFASAFHYQIDPENNKVKGARFRLAGLPGLLSRHHIIIEP